MSSYGYAGITGIWIFVMLIGVGLAFIPATIARKKGYSYGGFWVFGFFLFLPALIVALVIQDKTAPQGYQGYQPYPPYQQSGQPYGQQPPYGQPYPPYQQPNQPYGQQSSNAQPGEQAYRIHRDACPSCGAPVTEESLFCSKCGTRLK